MLNFSAIKVNKCLANICFFYEIFFFFFIHKYLTSIGILNFHKNRDKKKKVLDKDYKFFIIYQHSEYLYNKLFNYIIPSNSQNTKQ